MTTQGGDVGELVCPQCGRAADRGARFCAACGFELGSQFVLPTREEWIARRRDEAATQPSPVAERPAEDRPPVHPPEAVRTDGVLDRLLGAGAATLSASVLLGASAATVLAIDALNRDAPTGTTIAYWLQVAAFLAAIALLAVAAAGFFGAPGQRSARLRVGWFGGAGVAALLAVAGAGIAFDYAHYHAPGTFVAGAVVVAVGYVVLAAALLTAGTGYLAPAHEHSPRRASRLGAMSVLVAVTAALDLVSSITQAVGYSDFHAPSGIVTGLGLQAASGVIAVAGALVAAAAFFGFARGQAASLADAVRRRNAVLAVGGGLLAGSFLLDAIGEMVIAGTSGGNDFGGPAVASAWLTAVEWLGFTAAFSCAAVGLYLARRAALRRSA